MSAGLRAGTNNDGYLQINGTDVLTALSSGHIGVGTATPSGYSNKILHVHGSTGSEIHLTSGGTGALQNDGLSLYVRDSDGTCGLIFRENNAFQLGTSDTSRLYITGAGNVGIGTTNPSFGKLDIAGPTENQIRINNTNETGHGTVNAKIVAGGSFYQTMNLHAANFVFQTFNGSAIGERIKITSAGDLHSVWNDGRFLGSFYDANYYMGFTFGANARELYIDNKSSDTRADIVFRTLEGAGTPVERLRVKSNGNIGIGTTNPSYTLDVQGGQNVTTQISLWGKTIGQPQTLVEPGRIYATAAGLGPGNLLLQPTGGNIGIGTTNPGALLHTYGKIRFGNNFNYYGEIDHDSASTGANIYNSIDTGGHSFRRNNNELFRIGSLDDLVGNVTVTAGNLVIGTSGRGIDFSVYANAAGMTSELLNDYEEGTWTATIATESGTAYTLSSQTCKYIKVGKTCTIQASITFTAEGSGTIAVINLPFVADSSNTHIFNGHVTSGNNVRSIQLTSYGSSAILPRFDDGTQYINYWTPNTGWAPTNSFNFSGSYITA